MAALTAAVGGLPSPSVVVRQAPSGRGRSEMQRPGCPGDVAVVAAVSPGPGPWLSCLASAG